MRNLLSDYSALREGLFRCPTCCHTHYLRVSRAFPLRIPPTKEYSRADDKLHNLKTLEPVPPKLTPLPPLDVTIFHPFD